MDTVFPRLDAGHQGPTLEPGLEVGHVGERLVAGLSPMEPGRAQLEEETWVSLSMDSPPVGGAKGVRSNREPLFSAVWGSKTTENGRWSLRASRRKNNRTNPSDLFVLEAFNQDCGMFKTMLALPFEAWAEKMEKSRVPGEPSSRHSAEEPGSCSDEPTGPAGSCDARADPFMDLETLDPGTYVMRHGKIRNKSAEHKRRK
ncbi:hypothetical protein CRENBAI_026209 [Crenichthys baileyi]|uniref:Uncharacterized protein n=1 Tax=Crenichthys baileyi TaxID=28760 RepID=A0AAV9QNN0_9TELE